MNNITLVLFLVIASGTVFSQQAKTSEITYDTDYLLEEFRLPGGLAGNNVNCIVQGPHGFLWFGSHGGLHRYDGYEIITYDPVESDTIGETTSLTFPYIENLYWDRFNKLWVTTYGGGLFRFDPETETFKHFKADPDDPGALPHLQVLCAAEDANGELWFGTGKGLCHFDRKTEKFTTYFTDPNNANSLRHDRIGNIYVDKQGTLWIGTGQVLFIPEPGGISRFHPETNSFSNFGYKRSPDDKSFLGAVTPMLEDSRGNFWVGTTDGLFKMDRQASTFEKMPFDLGKAAVYGIYEDRAGGLWVSTVGAASHPSHLLRYDPETRSTQHFPIQTHVWQVIESADGTVWAAGAGVGGKVWKLSPKALEFDLQRGGNIKMAFPSSKLIKDLNVNAAYNFTGPLDMTIDPATGIFWVQYMLAFYDTVVIAPVLPVLASYDPNSGNCEFYPLHGLCDKVMDNTLPGNLWDPAGMAVDKYGKIWGTFKHEQIGIYSFDPKNGAIQHFTHNPNPDSYRDISLTSNHVISLMMDSRGEIWAGSYHTGLNRLNPESGKITHYHFYDKDSIWHDDIPVALIEHPDGKIWVGGELTAGAQAFVSIIDPATDSIQEFPLTEMFANASINSMVLQPQQGWLTLVMRLKGFCLYDFEDQRFNPLNTNNGELPFDDVASILYDRNGDLWAASLYTGNFVFWPIMEGTSSTKYLFKNKSGLGSHYRRAIIGPNNGHLYFLNSEGWTEIDPENLNVESPADSSITTLVDFYVQGEKQAPGKGGILSKPLWMLTEITLPNDAETFGFRFTDFNFRDGSPKYKYRLYPYETVWREKNQEPVANYYKIPHGKYEFQVRAFKENGQPGEHQTELKVTILPPWWKTWWAYTIYGLLFMTAIYYFDRFQRRRIIQQERQRSLEKEAAQKREIEKAYADLKATQSQLIQSEKMASLGELTAGIAHEIQNPLNFVNNFSEVNDELIEELKRELAVGSKQSAEEILNDIKSNSEKINHHGKRADAIVKGMLQHSRSSSGVKQPTDINALSDEYLRLAYHGLRAKDKAFNAKFETDFDSTLPKMNVVPQDIGRVLLNLINNAFYAVQLESQNSASLQETPQNQPDYKPMVMVSTKNMGTHIEIRVKDNGPGIPDGIKDKIFQPFFTTKPTGQGTGLGLSLSYDIVKAHGGELKVESEEGRGSEFILQIPIS